MPPTQLPMNPARMLRFGEYPDPVSDAVLIGPRSNVVRAPVSTSKPDVRPLTPAVLRSRRTISIPMPKRSRAWDAGVLDLPNDTANAPY